MHMRGARAQSESVDSSMRMQDQAPQRARNRAMAAHAESKARRARLQETVRKVEPLELGSGKSHECGLRPLPREKPGADGCEFCHNQWKRRGGKEETLPTELRSIWDVRARIRNTALHSGVFLGCLPGERKQCSQ